MKKRSLKNLVLNKKSISNLNLHMEIKGGISGYHYTCSSEECASEENPSEPGGTELIDCWGTTVLTYGRETCAD